MLEFLWCPFEPNLLPPLPPVFLRETLTWVTFSPYSLTAVWGYG